MFDTIIKFSINNKIIIGMMVLALVGWGGYSLTQLPIDAIPDVTNNQVVILSQTPTLAAQEVEQYITSPIEQQMANLQGVEEIRSTSRLGLSVITIVFDEFIPILQARQLVAEQLKATEDKIPTQFGKPELAPITTGLGEIYQYTIIPKKGYENKYSLTDLRTIQDWIIKRQLAGVKGVIEISSFGGYVKQYEVSANPERLRANNISMAELYEALSRNNANTGGSYIEKNNQAYFIRGEGTTKSLSDIENIVIKTVGGTPLLVREVATVQFGHANRFGAMTQNGKGETVGAVVLMLKGADSEKTIKGVKERIERIQKTLPEGLVINAFIDRTKLISKAIHTVETNLIEGGLIVVFVLVLLMGSIRAGFLVASVIPLSMLATLSLMNTFGISANLMSLGAIDFGLIIDGSIIVVEGILHYLQDKAHLPEKTKLTQAEMDGVVFKATSKILNSAIFGVIIILTVYLPLLSLSGVEGKMFQPMAITVSLAIVSALVLSLTYVPAVSALLLKDEGNKHFKLSDTIVNTIFNVYQPLFKWAMAKKKLVAGIAFGLFVISLGIFSMLGGEFIPSLEEGDIAIDFQTPPGTSLTATIEATTKAQNALKKHFPEIDQIVGRIGASEVPTDPMPVEMSDLMISMKEKSEWVSAESKEEMFEKMADVIDREVPGMSVEFTQPIQMRFNEMIAGSRSEIVVKIFGNDLEKLAERATACAKIIERIEGVASIKIERLVGLPQISVVYNREKLAQYGLHIEDLNLILKTAFAGEKTGTVFEEEKRFDMILRLDSLYRNDIEGIKALYVKLNNGSYINFEEVAEIAYIAAPAQISHENTRRRITIGISPQNRDVESLVQEIQEKLDVQIKLPAGYYIVYGGAFENLQKAKDRLSIAVPIALLLIFMLLYFTFHSFRQAFMIFTAIPLSAIGGIVALWIRDMPFSISAGVGFIALFGVAVLNGIVLISHLNQLEEEGHLDIYKRTFQGVKNRFRPVLMTASVASLGFLPMAISNSAGAEVQKPLATVVIGGLISATLLTLVILPVIYTLFNKNKVQ
ncbi:efflux RND transporter permease subunit [Emticicia agri]|uniref:Efflux RND transporter permease subunit n=1 Tax=Emticicia agri TaxID=2492393 RepID=A0A4Q5M088_9BACT|nr:CusA/CzcA family heavy metal efflux RND transporter [Emticicia agri]RYU95542.1 efflux RND transporter permease subunit [Emticicia agri]